MDRWVDQAEMARATGIVIPAYFSAKPTDDMVRHLLWMTLSDCSHYLPLDQVWVVVDGDGRTARLVAEARGRLGRAQGGTFNLLELPENHGKLWAIQEGCRALLADKPHVEYVAIRDGDGDHVMSDLPPLVRAALYLTTTHGTTRVLAIGARRSRQRPMGWVRGELEALLDQVTLAALAYALARAGRALDLRNCLCLGGVPDLSSGYKVYGRLIAEHLFVRPAAVHLASLSASDYWHFAPETATLVEALLAGTALAETQRLTWDGQPTTSFGEFRHVTMYGELLAWVYARLEIPLDVAAQLYDNVVPTMPLRTTAQGRETLDALRTYALHKVWRYRGAAGEVPPPKPTLPFV